VWLCSLLEKFTRVSLNHVVASHTTHVGDAYPNGTRANAIFAYHAAVKLRMRIIKPSASRTIVSATMGTGTQVLAAHRFVVGAPVHAVSARAGQNLKDALTAGFAARTLRTQAIALFLSVTSEASAVHVVPSFQIHVLTALNAARTLRIQPRALRLSVNRSHVSRYRHGDTIVMLLAVHAALAQAARLGKDVLAASYAAEALRFQTSVWRLSAASSADNNPQT
jgi:hypothetical protein